MSTPMNTPSASDPAPANTKKQPFLSRLFRRKKSGSASPAPSDTAASDATASDPTASTSSLTRYRQLLKRQKPAPVRPASAETSSTIKDQRGFRVVRERFNYGTPRREAVHYNGDEVETGVKGEDMEEDGCDGAEGRGR